MGKPQLTIVPEHHPTTKDLDREAQMLQLLNACMYSTNRHERAKLWAEYVGYMKAGRLNGWLGMRNGRDWENE